MVQVKVFDEEHEDDLTDAINSFLQENREFELIDISFSTAVTVVESEQIYCFSALLVYLDKSLD